MASAGRRDDWTVNRRPALGTNAQLVSRAIPCLSKMITVLVGSPRVSDRLPDRVLVRTEPASSSICRGGIVLVVVIRVDEFKCHIRGCRRKADPGAATRRPRAARDRVLTHALQVGEQLARRAVDPLPLHCVGAQPRDGQEDRQDADHDQQLNQRNSRFGSLHRVPLQPESLMSSEPDRLHRVCQVSWRDREEKTALYCLHGELKDYRVARLTQLCEALPIPKGTLRQHRHLSSVGPTHRGRRSAADFPASRARGQHRVGSRSRGANRTRVRALRCRQIPGRPRRRRTR